MKMNQRIKERTNERTNEQIDRRTDKRLNMPTIWTHSGFGYCCTDKSYMYRYWILFHSASQGQIDKATITEWDWTFLLKDTETSPRLQRVVRQLR